MMKKIFLAVALSCLAIVNTWAEFVTPDKASQLAAGFLRMSVAPTAEQRVSQRAAVRGGQVEPEYYVFNKPTGGWVLISADDRVAPVIAYSHSGRFNADNMPANVSEWMDGICGVIDSVRLSGAKASERVVSMWKELGGENYSATDQVVLETAQWGQSSPYNQYCPIASDENERAVVGCVATAMAIIMKYYSWPQHGTGVVGGYTTRKMPTYIAPYSLDSHVYDWDKMPLTSALSSWSTANSHQVATLMHDCGVAVTMDYSYKYASGSHEAYAVRALCTNFSYSAQAKILCRSLYSTSEWMSMLRDELDAKHPLLYAANTADGTGHMFVCDGYSMSDNKLHINWGWDGDFNGFYTIDLAVDRIYLFDRGQSAIFGLVPSEDGNDVQSEPVIVPTIINSIAGLYLEQNTNVRIGSSIVLNTPSMINMSYNQTARGQFMVALWSRDGTVRQYVDSCDYEFPPFDGYCYSYDIGPSVLTVEPDLTDRFVLYKKEAGKWVPFRCDSELFPDQDYYCCGVTPDPLIIVPDDCRYGQTIKPELTYGSQPVKKISWSVNGQDCPDGTVTLNHGSNVICAKITYWDDSKGRIIKTVTVE